MEISFKSIVQSILKKWWVAAAALAAGALLGFLAGKFLAAESYTSDASLYVGLKSLSSEYDMAAQQDRILENCLITLTDKNFLKAQYEAMLESGAVLPADFPAFEDFQKCLKIERKGNYLFVQATADTPEKAFQIASRLSVGMIESKQLEKNHALYEQVDSLEIQNKAYLPEEKRSSGRLLYTAGGGLLGALIACVAIGVYRAYDKRLYSAEELTELYDIPVLGYVAGKARR